jgi:hypothetical protein
LEVADDLHAPLPVQARGLALRNAEGNDINVLFCAVWCSIEHGAVLSTADFGSIAQMAP